MILSEDKYKEKLLKKLNKQNSGWVDGDKKGDPNKKTADLVNPDLKIAIEIKDDTKYKSIKPPTSGVVSDEYDLDKMNKRMSDHLKSANNKFKEYPNHKTILILRTNLDLPVVIRYSFDGLHTYTKNKSKNLKHIGRKSKYSIYAKKHVGGIIIASRNYNFFENSYASKERLVKIEEVGDVLGEKINKTDKI